MKVKTSELIGPALDWAVAKCVGVETTIWFRGSDDPSGPAGWFYDYDRTIPYTPSTDWAQGGPIIEREEIAVGKGWEQWAAFKDADTEDGVLGPTPLIAAMRCYVASKMGDTIDVPDELAGIV